MRERPVQELLFSDCFFHSYSANFCLFVILSGRSSSNMSCCVTFADRDD